MFTSAISERGEAGVVICLASAASSLERTSRPWAFPSFPAFHKTGCDDFALPSMAKCEVHPCSSTRQERRPPRVPRPRVRVHVAGSATFPTVPGCFQNLAGLVSLAPTPPCGTTDRKRFSGTDSQSLFDLARSTLALKTWSVPEFRVFVSRPLGQSVPQLKTPQAPSCTDS